MAVAFTKDQQTVIDLRNCNILVSAAAGSGKTAVLVERIVQLVSDRTHPTDIDRLLIVTFTKAAAAQMRERIGRVLAARLEEDPGNRHLQRQLTLIHHAQITTIDSFCLYLIKNHFQDIGLDPDFRVADEAEARLLEQEVLEQLLEEKFQEKEPAFLQMVESLGAGGKESGMEELIRSLYGFVMSYPWPEEWLETHRSDAACTSVSELEQTPFARLIREQVTRAALGSIQNLKEAMTICEAPDGPYPYGKVLEADLAQAERVLAAAEKGLEALYACLGGLDFMRLPVKKDDTIDPKKRELVKQIRNGAKELLKDLQERYFYASPEVMAEHMQKAQPVVTELLATVLSYIRRLRLAKREKNLLDFHDMEHLALQILLQPDENGTMRPTGTAEEYREYFQEILIDEYQDSNLVQEYLLRSISGEEIGRFNRFMVGDVKQSIYKFRMARPELFLEKFSAYAAGQEGCRRVDLKQNFRSRRQVTESVNAVFSRIMGSELGGIEYNEEAALYPGASFPEPGADFGSEEENQRRYETEVLLAVEGEGREEKLTPRQQEALMIAGKIRELAGRFPVRDHDNGQLRPARFGDMVILLRTTSGWDEEFRKVLEEEGIPVAVTSRTGYFAAQEVQQVLQFLRVLNNPLQDIALFGTLHSLIGGFTDREIAILRAVGSLRVREDAEGTATESGGEPTAEAVRENDADTNTAEAAWEPGAETERENDAVPEKRRYYLYDCLKYYAENGKEAGLREKCEGFLEKLEHYRQLAVYLPIHKLLQQFVTESGFLHEITALPGGRQRRMNVEMLLAKAENYGKTSYTGLFHFVRYMEQMERYEMDYGEAGVTDENADTVRIMSIHKSKGLEFPICFVAGLAKSFNRQDISQPVIWDMDLGVAADWIDPVRRVKTKTLHKGVLADKLWQDNLGEELRVLYVAMTRAEEKLFLTGFYQEKKKAVFPVTGKVPYSVLAGAGSYLDFLMPVFLGEPDRWHITYAGPGERLAEQLKEDASRNNSLLRLRYLESEEACEKELEERLRARFFTPYAHENLAGLYVKTTVSEQKRAGMEAELEEGKALIAPLEKEPVIPAFLQPEQEQAGGVGVGTAYHRVLERFPFARAADGAYWEEKRVREVLEELREQKVISPDTRKLVRSRKLTAFLHSTLAERMRLAEKAGKLRREQPFVLGLPASQVNETFPEEETVLLQGIIDVWFEEADGIVLVDYKTDRIASEAMLADRYRVQLAYYARALEQLTGKPVKERWLYSFALEKAVAVQEDSCKNGLKNVKESDMI